MFENKEYRVLLYIGDELTRSRYIIPECDFYVDGVKYTSEYKILAVKLY